MSNHYLARTTILAARILQALLTLFAIVFVLGAVIGEMSVLAFVVIGPVAIFLLLLVGVVEIPVRAIKSRWIPDE